LTITAIMIALALISEFVQPFIPGGMPLDCCLSKYLCGCHQTVLGYILDGFANFGPVIAIISAVMFVVFVLAEKLGFLKKEK